MALEVIGAGFGRTGTTSLKLALEQIGFGPCHHMSELFKSPETAEHWAAAARGQVAPWESMFAGYRSAVDWPTADYWRELSALYPHAKIILTVRDTETWFQSTQATIFGPINTMMSGDTSPIGETMRAISTRNFNDRPNDRAACLAGFEAHNAAVQREVPPERLLVFEIKQGWEPLCRFLGVPVPDGPFPRANSTDEFREHVAAMMSGPKAPGPTAAS